MGRLHAKSECAAWRHTIVRTRQAFHHSSANSHAAPESNYRTHSLCVLGGTLVRLRGLILTRSALWENFGLQIECATPAHHPLENVHSDANVCLLRRWRQNAVSVLDILACSHMHISMGLVFYRSKCPSFEAECT